MNARYRIGVIGLAALLIAISIEAAEPELPDAKPVPDVQVVPLPYHQASFQLLGRELTRYHFGPTLRRPFCFPVVGVEGRWLTRMDHPPAPHGERHHCSVWISHRSVNGVSFWEDNAAGRVVHQRPEEYTDGPKEAWMLSTNHWQTGGEGEEFTVLMRERRRICVRPLGPDEWLMLIDLQLESPNKEPVTLGVTPFGINGVQVARQMCVTEGGGRMLNSEKQLNEEQIFRKPARWVDYSGPVTNRSTAGITLMDHPINPSFPSPFHVRNGGWMGACLTLEKPLVIPPGKPLHLRYALWVHPGVPKFEQIESRWKQFAESEKPVMEKTTK